jgi:hypothetical protein
VALPLRRYNWYQSNRFKLGDFFYSHNPFVMATKVDLDKVVADLIAQINNGRLHTDSCIQQADERMERRVAMVVEESKLTTNNLIQVVLAQMQNS